jgi:hypothetical protein
VQFKVYQYIFGSDFEAFKESASFKECEPELFAIASKIAPLFNLAKIRTV